MNRSGGTTTRGRASGDLVATLATIFSIVLAAASPVTADLIADDLFVQGGVCAGDDGECDGTETFGETDLLLKDDAPQIKFNDTSASSTSDNDWSIRVDEDLTIVDDTSGAVPFTVEAGAPGDALYIGSAAGGAAAALGIGAPPANFSLHIDSPSVPNILFNGNGGISPASLWRIDASATGFFLGDGNSGFTVPFFLRSGAPSSSLMVDSTGDIGVGTGFPEARLHVLHDGGYPEAELLVLENTGDARMSFLNGHSGESWQAGMLNSNQFIIDTTLTGNTDFVIFPDGNVQFGSFFKASANGSLEIAGKLKEGSSRTIKENFVEVEGSEVLRRLESLSITRWNYSADEADTVHMGPMAEDFHTAFGLGEDPEHIAPMDAAAVALVAVQEQQGIIEGQQAALVEKDRQIAALQDRLAALEELVSRELGARPASLASPR